jgi:predicted metal-binding protein
MGAESIQKCPGFERALIIVPELFTCPFCNVEVEIWTDEKRARCMHCEKMVSRERACRVDVAGDEDSTPKNAPAKGERGPTGPEIDVSPENCRAVNRAEVKVLEHTDGSGSTLFYEEHERVVEAGAIEHGKRYKDSCRPCPKYGKNLACPPHSPTFLEYVGAGKKARVLCIRVPQDYFNHLPFEDRYRACFRQARSLLSETLLGYRDKGQVIAGSGPCLACEECALLTGSIQCEKPEEKIYSLESLGINVIGLVKRHFDMDLEWSMDGRHADFVCAVGAAFYRDESAV